MNKNRKYILMIIFAILLIIAAIVLLIFLGNISNNDSVVANENQETVASSTPIHTKTPIELMPTPKPTQTPTPLKKVIEYKTVKCLSKHSITNYRSGDNRNTNMAVAAEIINGGEKGKGYILEPKETFSWIRNQSPKTFSKCWIFESW